MDLSVLKCIAPVLCESLALMLAGTLPLQATGSFPDDGSLHGSQQGSPVEATTQGGGGTEAQQLDPEVGQQVSGAVSTCATA